MANNERVELSRLKIKLNLSSDETKFLFAIDFLSFPSDRVSKRFKYTPSAHHFPRSGIVFAFYFWRRNFLARCSAIPFDIQIKTDEIGDD
jgi:hypothetical protein